MGRVPERSGGETSDSGNLLVLDNDLANLFTELTRSASLLKVKPTLIGRTVLSSTCVLSYFRFRNRSEDRAICMTFLIKDSG